MLADSDGSLRLQLLPAEFVDTTITRDNVIAGIEFEGSRRSYWAVQLWACTVNNYCAGYPTRTWKYDDRLKTQQPPHFIAPLNSDGRWTISRRTEQVPTPVGTT